MLFRSVPAVFYAALGGVQAVAWADVKQMVVIVFGLVAILLVTILGMPHGVGLGGALRVAGAAGRLQPFDFRLNLTETYTFWSGLLGGAFLMMSYFGTDQSQVQRYLAAPSEDDARASLANWIKMTEAIAKTYDKDTVFIAGHSGTKFPVTCAQADLMVMRDYITALLGFVTTQIKAGKSRDEIIAIKDVLKGFDDHGPLTAGPLTAAYDELTAK